jgi:hypothetical protein
LVDRIESVVARFTTDTIPKADIESIATVTIDRLEGRGESREFPRAIVGDINDVYGFRAGRRRCRTAQYDASVSYGGDHQHYQQQASRSLVGNRMLCGTR